MTLKSVCWQGVGLYLCACLGVLFSGNGFADDLEAGRATFDAYCAPCHGYDGIPIMPETPNFAKAERMEIADKDLLKSIMDGKGETMPPWGEILTPEQCAEVLAYIRVIPK